MTDRDRDTLLGVLIITVWAITALIVALVMINPQLIFGN